MRSSLACLLSAQTYLTFFFEFQIRVAGGLEDFEVEMDYFLLIMWRNCDFSKSFFRKKKKTTSDGLL